jgi:hypothetical protein
VAVSRRAVTPRWLLVTVTVTLSAGHGTLRVHVWRTLRSLGAVYMQSSLCLLPDRTQVVRDVRRHEGGSGRWLQIILPEPAQVDWLRGEFNAARDVEYGEVLERIPVLSAELASERAKGRAATRSSGRARVVPETR